MGSPTQWTWVWVDYGSWWWIGRLGMLLFMGSQSQTLLSDWTELNSIVYMYHNFLIHLSANGHLGCFHVLAVENSAVMNIGVHVSLSILVSSMCMPSSGIAGSYGSSISSFLRNLCGKILKEMEIPDHLTCMLRNLYAGQEATLELDMEQHAGSK